MPTTTVSIVDFTAEIDSDVTAEEINDAYREAAATSMQGIMDVTDEPLVSSDFRGDSHSAILDSLSTIVIGGNMVKVLAWYDNEWGYSCRVADLAQFMASKGL